MGGTLPTKPRALPQHPAPGLALDRQLNLTRLSERLTQLKEAGEGSSEGSDAASNGEGDGAVGLAGAPSLAEALFGLRRSGGQSQSRPAATPEGRTTPTATPRGGRPAATGAGTGAGLSPRGAPAGPEGPQSAGLAPAHSGLGARGAVGAVLGGAGSVSLRRSSSFARGIGGGVPGRGTADDGALTGREAAAGSVGGVGRGSLRRTRSFSKFEASVGVWLCGCGYGWVTVHMCTWLYGKQPSHPPLPALTGPPALPSLGGQVPRHPRQGSGGASGLSL